MVQPFTIGGYIISDESPVFMVAEIGLNHNGDMGLAQKLIDVAVAAGCQMVKFQKRTPELCVPEAQRNIPRETPWGVMSYLNYRHKIEFGEAEYATIARYCKAAGILWTASAWDIPSVDFLEDFAVPCHKVPSACLTDHALLRAMKRTGKPVLLSTGMSTPAEIERAVQVLYDGLPPHPTVLMHCTSTYPCAPEELNLRCIQWLKQTYPLIPIGYSGHETGIPPTLAAVAMGAVVVERHITMNRTLWGSDHAASLEPVALAGLVRGIRTIERACGDGIKRVYDSELPIKAKLRRQEVYDGDCADGREVQQV